MISNTISSVVFVDYCTVDDDVESPRSSVLFLFVVLHLQRRVLIMYMCVCVCVECQFA
jgi:hypothetical protein